MKNPTMPICKTVATLFAFLVIVPIFLTYEVRADSFDYANIPSENCLSVQSFGDFSQYEYLTEFGMAPQNAGNGLGDNEVVIPSDFVKWMSSSSPYVDNFAVKYDNDTNTVLVGFELLTRVYWADCVIYKKNCRGIYVPFEKITTPSSEKHLPGPYSGKFYVITEPGDYAVELQMFTYYWWDYDYVDLLFRVDPDNDFNKSDVSSHTIMCTQLAKEEKYMDMKGKYLDSYDAERQNKLVENFSKPLGINNYEIIASLDVYPRRDLTINEMNSLQTLRWNGNTDIGGSVYAVVYDQVNGGYIIAGKRDADGSYIFPNYKLTNASTVSFVRILN